MSGFLGYVYWEKWKQSGQTIMLHGYLVSNFDQFYWPIGDGADVIAHYKIPLSYYYLSGNTPTPIVEKTPTPENTPSPIQTPTPYPEPTQEIELIVEKTPTPTQTPIGIDDLNLKWINSSLAKSTINNIKKQNLGIMLNKTTQHLIDMSYM